LPHRFPDSPVFYRHLARDYPLIVRGEGCWLIDEQGKRYLDGVGGAFVANLGHGVAEIGEAMARQAASIAYVNGTAFTNAAVEALAARLTALTPGYDLAYVLGSGSEAVEAALKLARQHWVERGRPNKHKVIALSPSYHGNTMLALSAGAREHYRRFWQQWMIDIVKVPAPYGYRCGCNGELDCPVCTGTVLEEVIAREGAETIAAFIAEPVGGSSTGANVPRETYYRTLRAICDRHELLFIADEVLCGAGRTGTWTALEAWGVTADVTVLGKGISGGYAPVSAVLTRRDIVEPLACGTGYLMHAQTFSHHAVTCAAAVAALEYLDRHRLVERCAAIGPFFQETLRGMSECPAVGDVRGRGLLAGIEFVADKSTTAPFDRSLKFAETFTEAALAEGLTVWPNVGHADGTRGDLVCLAPPFVIREDEIGELDARLRAALSATTRRLGIPR
jgi:adenosylmethionine-8-amino-7-oxononanoate aminotransferase